MTSNGREEGRTALGSAEERASCAWKTASTPISTRCGRHSPTPHVWPAGTARSGAICAPAVSTAYAFLPADGKAPGARVCEPPQRLLVRNKNADEPDEQVIEALLTADGDQTIVVWEERGMPLNLLSAYGAGVQLHVEDLTDHLAGRERRDDAKARWDELDPAYQDLAANVS